MDWFRVYAAARHDPKIQLLPAPLFRQWFNLLCLASDQQERGTLPDMETIAYELHMKSAAAKKMIADLMTAGLVDETDGGFAMHGWNRRQFASDDVTLRTRRHRGLNNVPPDDTGTFPERTQRSDSDADTEEKTDTESVPRAREDERTDELEALDEVRLAFENEICLIPTTCWEEFKQYARFTPTEWFLAAVEVTRTEAEHPSWAFCKSVIDNAMRQNRPPDARRPAPIKAKPGSAAEQMLRRYEEARTR